MTGIEIRDVGGPVHARLVRDAAVREFRTHLQCNPEAEPYPSMELLLKAVEDPSIHVVAAWDRGRPMMFAIARESGEVVWLCACAPWAQCAPPNTTDSAYVKLTLNIAFRCGDVHGHVENEAVRQLILATCDLTYMDGSHMRIHPELADRPSTQ